MDVTINFAEAIGIQPGCPLTLLVRLEGKQLVVRLTKVNLSYIFFFKKHIYIFGRFITNKVIMQFGLEIQLSI